MRVMILGGGVKGLSAALAIASVECNYLIREIKQIKYHSSMKEVRGHCYPWYKKVK